MTLLSLCVPIRQLSLRGVALFRHDEAIPRISGKDCFGKERLAMTLHWGVILNSGAMPAVYILSNKNNTVLYTGVTHNLIARTVQHKQKLIPGFTKRYNVDKLVYFEFYADIRDAIAREKQIKAGSRKKKIALIESMNPEWRDLFNDILG